MTANPPLGRRPRASPRRGSPLRGFAPCGRRLAVVAHDASSVRFRFPLHIHKGTDYSEHVEIPTVAGVTLEYRDNGHPGGRKNVVTTACGLCAEDLRERQGMSDHLPSCPVREIYAEPGALRNGGPSRERLEAALAKSDAPAATLATDGGHDHGVDAGGDEA